MKRTPQPQLPPAEVPVVLLTDDELHQFLVEVGRLAGVGVLKSVLEEGRRGMEAALVGAASEVVWSRNAAKARAFKDAYEQTQRSLRLVEQAFLVVGSTP